MKSIVVLTAFVCAFAIGPLAASAESGVVVTEVMANPLSEDSDEFVEFYNPTPASVDLSGWSVTDGDALDTVVAWDVAAHGALRDADALTGSLMLAPGAIAVLLDAEYASGPQGYDFPSKTLVVTVSNTTLGNGLTTNDALTVYDSAKAVVSTYGTPMLAPDWHDADDDVKDGIPFDPGNGVSVERIDTLLGDVESNWEASASLTGSTPGTLRLPPQEPETPEDNPDENDGEDSKNPAAPPPTTPPANPPVNPPGGSKPDPSPSSPEDDENHPSQDNADRKFSDDVFLSEIFPNPEGSDDAEFIELANDGGERVSLVGWVLADASQSYTIEVGDVAPHGLLVLDREMTGLTLNNSGSETVELRDPNGEVKSSMEYSGAKEGQSYSFVEDEWVWSDVPTRGAKNVFEEANAEPVAAIDAPESGRTHQKIRFDAGGSHDPDTDDELEYTWDFDDGETCNDAACEHGFDSGGIYAVTLRVSDTRGAEDEAEHQIEIHQVDLSDAIILSEVVVNPEGRDEDGEWVELANTAGRDVNLFGWTITDEKAYFTIEEKTTISAGGFMVFDRSMSAITLNNSSERLYLIDPAGTIQEGVEIDGGKEGQSFAKSESGTSWTWTTTPTKGEENRFADAGEEGGNDESKQDDDHKVEEVSASATEKVSPVVKGVSAVATIAALREATKGSAVTFEGRVTAAPGEISRDFFFVQDDTGGVQVYSSAAAFPALNLGDLVEITGKISKSAQEFRVNVSSESGVSVLGGDEAVTPENVTSLEDHDGKLGSISGEITSKRATSWNVGMENGEEVAVKFLASGSVVPPSVVVGQRVTVTGVVRVKKGVPELLPRSADDLVVEQPTGEVLGAADTATDKATDTTAGVVSPPSHPSSTNSSPLLPLLAAGYVVPLGALVYMYKIRVQK